MPRVLLLAVAILANVSAGCVEEAAVPAAVPADDASAPDEAVAPTQAPDAPPRLVPGLGPATTLLRDPKGDSVEYNHEYATRNSERCRVAGRDAAAACANALGGTYRTLEPTGPIPAPPALDILELRVSESPTTVRFTLVVAELDADLAEAAPADGSKAAAWGVCWGDRNEGPQCASLHARRVAGVLVTEARMVHWSGQCNDWWFCAWSVPWSLEAGAPGLVHLDVPRDLLDDPASLAAVSAVTERLEHLPDEPRWSVAGPSPRAGGVPQEWSRYHTDLARLDGDHGLATHPEPPQNASGPFTFEDAAGDVARGRADLDILTTSIVETTEAVTFSHRIALVREDAAVHTMSIAVGVPGGRVVAIDVEAGPEGRTAYAWSCTDAECGDVVEPPVDVAVSAGSPGWVNVTLRRADLADPVPQDLLTLVVTTMSAYGTRLERAEGGVELAGEHAADSSPVAPPYRFRLRAA